MQASTAVLLALLGLACQQTLAADCPDGPPAGSTDVSWGPSPDGKCPTGQTCYLSDGMNQCFGPESTPVICTDNSTYCGAWVKNGFCTNSFYASQVANYCAKSCGLCPKDDGCKDESVNCKTWVANNFCNSVNYTPEQVKQYCAKSCNLC